MKRKREREIDRVRYDELRERGEGLDKKKEGLETERDREIKRER